MKIIKICVFTSIAMLCITKNCNSTDISNNTPPSPSFYFNLNHDSVIEELTSTINKFDNATNSNIVNIIQSTTSELNNICEYTNNNDCNLTDQMNKYNETVKKLRKSFKQVRKYSGEDVNELMDNSIKECLSSCKTALQVIDKPVEQSHTDDNQTVQLSTDHKLILDILKSKKQH